jgi:hypothetical protein
MSRKRVHELAKDLGIDVKDLISRLEQLGIRNKRSQSSLTEDEVERVKAHLAVEESPSVAVGYERVVHGCDGQTIVARRVRTNVIRRRTTRFEPVPVFAAPEPLPEPLDLLPEPPEPLAEPLPAPEPAAPLPIDQLAFGRGAQEKTEITTTRASERVVTVFDVISVDALAEAMGVNAAEIIKKLIACGMRVGTTQVLDFDTASL